MYLDAHLKCIVRIKKYGDVIEALWESYSKGIIFLNLLVFARRMNIYNSYKLVTLY